MPQVTPFFATCNFPTTDAAFAESAFIISLYRETWQYWWWSFIFFFVFKSISKIFVDVYFLTLFVPVWIIIQSDRYWHFIKKKYLRQYFCGKILLLLNHSLRMNFPSKKISLNRWLLIMLLLKKNFKTFWSW